MRSSAFLAAALGLGLLSLGPAAPATAQTQAQPMAIAVVRLAAPGCGADCPEAISLQGVVQPDSHRRFQAVLDGLQSRKPLIVVNSPGGNVDAALAMGRAIRAAGLSVAVGRTPPAPACRPEDAACEAAARGRPGLRTIAAEETICSSACTLILAGGIRRIAAAQARIGVHQMAQSETERVVERVYRRAGEGGEREIVQERVISQRTRGMDVPAEVANRGVPEHFAAMGISRAFTDLTLATPHSQIRVLSPKEMLETRIVTDQAEPLKTLGLVP